MPKAKNKKEFYIWEGIYKNLKEAPIQGLGFRGSIWEKRSLASIREILKAKQSKKIIPESVIYRDCLLPFLVSLISKGNKSIKIIDFGGNLGQEYLKILDGSEIKQNKIDYTIVETKEIREAGEKLFKKKNLRFKTSLPKNAKVDIIHVGSTLQYIENWKGLLREFASLTPKYILFTDLQAGDIPTYVTVQNYYDSKMPVWFFNVKEIIKELEQFDYKLVFKSTFRGKFLGIEQDRPQENLLKKFRLKNSCSLLFTK